MTCSFTQPDDADAAGPVITVNCSRKPQAHKVRLASNAELIIPDAGELDRPSSVPSNVTSNPASRYSDDEVSSERDDWWYKGTDNLFLNRSGEHRTPALTELERLY